MAEQNEDDYEEEYDERLMNLKKMAFIYNAINDGWKVKKKGKNLYEFTKNRLNNHIVRQLKLDQNELINFVNNNSNIQEILNSM